MEQEPAHGWWCNSRTYPTRCPYCKEKVFFFSCDHGSRVFFDSLGWPWPIHDCIDNIIRQIDVQIQEEYANRVAQRSKKKEWEIPIVSQAPQENQTVCETGIVRETSNSVDIYKKFNLPANAPLVAAQLEKLGIDKIGQITIHVDDVEKSQTQSYTFFVNLKYMNQAKISKGDIVLVNLSAKTILGRSPFWLCISLDKPF